MQTTQCSPPAGAVAKHWIRCRIVDLPACTAATKRRASAEGLLDLLVAQQRVDDRKPLTVERPSLAMSWACAIALAPQRSSQLAQPREWSSGWGGHCRKLDQYC